MMTIRRETGKEIIGGTENDLGKDKEWRNEKEKELDKNKDKELGSAIEDKSLDQKRDQGFASDQGKDPDKKKGGDKNLDQHTKKIDLKIAASEK